MLTATRWLWVERTLPARLVRLLLLPPAWLYQLITAARARAYRTGFLPRAIPPVPTVAVGNLTVGGSGKTPIAAWIAGYYADRGVRPGVVLRGYGGDEASVHRGLVADAVVVENPDRMTGAAEAVMQGARVVVLDDAFQRLDIARDLNIAVVSAESSRAVRWTLPAGPWREGWSALRRADFVVITRKRADRAAARAVASRVSGTVPGVRLALARLGIAGFRGLLSRKRVDPSEIEGARVVAAAGIGDPASFASQCQRLGAEVRLVPWRDHHRFTEGDVTWLLQAARRVDYVVVTEKDAVKLRGRWPSGAPEPLVAELAVTWERGRAALETALDAITADTAEFLAPG
ncbi:MAG: hypothetical protein GTO22_02920 [Gemmatimonadales bacterium]|nr:hypothetical protein [Gemmatimonadales bacterium]